MNKKQQQNIFLEGPTVTAHRILAGWLRMGVTDIKIIESFLHDHYGINDFDINDPDARISCRIVSDLTNRISRMTNNPVIGLSYVKESVLDKPRWNYYDVAREVATNVRDYVDMIGRYSLLETENITIASEVEGENLICRQSVFDPEYTSYHQTDYALLSVKEAIKARYEVLPTKVTLMQTCPEGFQALYEGKFESPVYFKAEENKIFYPLGPCLEQREAQGSLGGLHFVESKLSKYLLDKNADNCSSESIVSQVDFWIERLLIRGEPRRKQVAKLMGLSVRTMQRKLTLEKETFKSVLGQCRKKIGMQYIDDSSLSVVDIAWLLGYTEPSQLYQAFRRWNGISLSQYRNKDK